MTTNDLLDSYTEVFVMDGENGETKPHFECSQCDREVDDEPCPDHAPLTDLPGLRLIECDADPKHYTWVHQRDDYGIPCPWCLLNDQAKQDAEARQCRHLRWRRTRAFRWLAGMAYSLGVISGSCHSKADGCDWCVTLYWRGSRPYILGASRDTWHCWRRRHRRGEEVGFGFCGKCVPCPDCTSETASHREGCAL
jgi:hypothetical protein